MKQLSKNGKCLICGGKEHKNPAVMYRKDLQRHRLTERRNCRNYEDCLTEVALANGVCVPCKVCDSFASPLELVATA